MTSSFLDGGCGTVAMFGFTCAGALGAINLMCVRFKGLALRPDVGDVQAYAFP